VSGPVINVKEARPCACEPLFLTKVDNPARTEGSLSLMILSPHQPGNGKNVQDSPSRYRS